MPPELSDHYISTVRVSEKGANAYLGPICPAFILGAKRRLIRFTSLGSLRAPDPSRIASRRFCNLRIRCGRDTMTAVCCSGSRVDGVSNDLEMPSSSPEERRCEHRGLEQDNH